jgi:hypothetical protein
MRPVEIPNLAVPSISPAPRGARRAPILTGLLLVGLTLGACGDSTADTSSGQPKEEYDAEQRALQGPSDDNTALAFGEGELFSIDAAPDGTVYAADQDAQVFRITPEGAATLVAGTGDFRPDNLDEWAADNEFDGTPGVEATLLDPVAVRVGPDGTVFLLEVSATVSRVLALAPDGSLSVLATSTPDDEEAEFPNLGPCQMGVGPGGEVFLIDCDANAVRRLDPTTGEITKVVEIDPDDERFQNSASYAVSISPTGEIYLSGGDWVAKANSDGTITHLAGSGEPIDGTDGAENDDPACEDAAAATEMALGTVGSIVVEDDGSLIVSGGDSDENLGCIWRIAPDGSATVLLDLSVPLDVAIAGQEATIEIDGWPYDLGQSADGTIFAAIGDTSHTVGVPEYHHILRIPVTGDVEAIAVQDL